MASERNERAELGLELRSAQRRIIEETEAAIVTVEYFVRESRRTLEQVVSEPESLGIDREPRIAKLPGKIARDIASALSNANGQLDNANAAARRLSALRAQLAAAPAKGWTFTKQDPGFSGYPAFWLEGAEQTWAIVVNYEDDTLSSIRMGKDGEVISESHKPMGGVWTMTALKKALGRICEAYNLEPIALPLLADLFISEGW